MFARAPSCAVSIYVHKPSLVLCIWFQDQGCDFRNCTLISFSGGIFFLLFSDIIPSLTLDFGACVCEIFMSFTVKEQENVDFQFLFGRFFSLMLAYVSVKHGLGANTETVFLTHLHFS